MGKQCTCDVRSALPFNDWWTSQRGLKQCAWIWESTYGRTCEINPFKVSLIMPMFFLNSR
jgi:hypothetical protein